MCLKNLFNVSESNRILREKNLILKLDPTESFKFLHVVHITKLRYLNVNNILYISLSGYNNNHAPKIL